MQGKLDSGASFCAGVCWVRCEYDLESQHEIAHLVSEEPITLNHPEVE